MEGKEKDPKDCRKKIINTGVMGHRMETTHGPHNTGDRTGLYRNMDVL